MFFSHPIPSHVALIMDPVYLYNQSCCFSVCVFLTSFLSNKASGPFLAWL